MRIFLLLVGCSAHFVDERPFYALAGDLASSVDAAPLVDALPDRTLARGTFMGLAGHSGAGTGSLVAGPNGLTIELGADFVVTGVPGPELVLSARESLGTAIDPSTDLDLGPLRYPQGSQIYATVDDGGRRNLFVFCKPFGIGVALAALQDLP